MPTTQCQIYLNWSTFELKGSNYRQHTQVWPTKNYSFGPEDCYAVHENYVHLKVCYSLVQRGKYFFYGAISYVISLFLAFFSLVS